MLTNEQLEHFKRDGFVVAKGLFSRDDMEAITAWTDEVTNRPEEPGKVMMYFEQSLTESNKRIISRIEDLATHHPQFRELFRGQKMQGSVGELFGEDAVLFKDKINFKMPGSDGFKAHQDMQAGWTDYAKLHITAMITIDESTIENGCLELAAGHHDKGLIGAMWEPLTDSALDNITYVAYPLHPGDTVFFDSYAPHRSAPNKTDTPRRVIFATYNKLSEGDHLRQYYDDKRKNYPPDCEREPEKEYRFKV